MNAKARVDLSLNRREAQRVLKLLESETKAYHNWIASAIESGHTQYATWLVKELREHQELATLLRGKYKNATGLLPEEDQEAKPKWFTDETGLNTDGTPANK